MLRVIGAIAKLRLQTNYTLTIRLLFRSSLSSYTFGLKLKLIPASVYDPIIDRAYDALKTTGVKSMGDGYLIPVKVSGGTCVGSKEYYLTRKITEGTGFGYGSFILFGLAYEQYKGIRK